MSRAALILLLLAAGAFAAALHRYSVHVVELRAAEYSVVRSDNWTGAYDAGPIMGYYREHEGLTLAEIVSLKLGGWFDSSLALYRSARSAGSGPVSCEACVLFGGQERCAAATAANVEEASHAAIVTACAYLTRGVDETSECGRRDPLSVDCDL